MTTPNIVDCMEDRKLFAPHFVHEHTWLHWKGFLAALFGLPPDESGRRAFRRCTKRQTFPTQPAKEAWLICGRRSGKSFVLSLCAVYLAAFVNWKPYLGVGERAVVMLVAADRRQAQILLRYIKALLKQTPVLAGLIDTERSDEIGLTNRVTIEIVTSSFKTSRGRAVCAALLDELAFWPVDDNAAEPDSEIIAAIRPSMAQFPNALLLCASSPYAKKGELYAAYRKYFGKEGPVLVWQSPTSYMNETIPASVIREAFERDPASANAEYGAQFRSDIESYISREVVDACVASELYERRPLPNLRYVAFCDPSGGSADSYTLAIAHRDGDQLLLDCVRETLPPFSPESVTVEYAHTCKTYGVSRVIGDRYAGEWPREQFSKRGVAYEVSGKTKSDLYRDLLPLLNSKSVSLLDHARLVAQLTGLERRTARSGRDSIDHAPGQHDDIANACAGALTNAHAGHRQGLRVGAISGIGGGRIVWHAPEKERPRVRVVKVPERIAPASRGIA